MRAIFAWGGVVGCVAMLACGDGEARREHDAATTDASVESPAVAPGTCDVIESSRLEVPSDFAITATSGVQRVRGGFVLSASRRCDGVGGDFLFALTAGVVLRLEVSPENVRPGLCTVPLAADATDPAVIVTSYETETPAGDTSPLGATSWRGMPPAPGTPQTIGEAYFRGTVRRDGAPSFDGKRAVIATGHVAVDPLPQAIMLGLDGARVGEVASLGFEGSPLLDALSVTPTEHGAVVSALDNARGLLRLIELAGDGSVVQAVAHPFTQSGGSFTGTLVVSSPTALLVALTRPDASPQVMELSAGEVHELTAPPTGSPRWIAKASDGGLLWLESGSAQSLRMLHISTTGATRVLNEDLGSARAALPGESGRLFLVREFTSGTQQIDEVGCRL